MSRYVKDLKSGKIAVFGWDPPTETYWLEIWTNRERLADGEQPEEEHGVVFPFAPEDLMAKIGPDLTTLEVQQLVSDRIESASMTPLQKEVKRLFNFGG